MKIFESENKKQLLKSFIVGVMWTIWIYLWFFHRSFTVGTTFFDPWVYIFPFNYILSVFTLYSILYLPQYSNNNKLSFNYLLKICFYELINVLLLNFVYLLHHLIPLIILILLLNFIIVWKAKYTQLRFWEKFKSTITLRVKIESRIKENQVKLLIFVFSGVILLNLSGFYFNEGDIIYILFLMTQIAFSIGHFYCVSENRKWRDRIIDFIALITLNFINLTFKYVVWSYIKFNYDEIPLFYILAFLLEFFQVYIYYSFFSRTYLADFSINLHKIPDPLNELLGEPAKHEQSYCPKCGNEIELLDSSIKKENSTIFCPFCGEKIIRYELLDISEAELLIKHQKVLQQLDNKSEPRSYLP